MRRWISVTVVFVAVATIIAGSVLVAVARSTRLEAGLSGDKEVNQQGEQGVGDPNGRGKAVVRVNVSGQRVCFDLSWRQIAAPSAAHIHDGDPGRVGPVVVNLFTTGDEAAADEQDLPDSVREVGGCVRVVDGALLRKIKNNPGNYYVNVHNDDFADGAIRGQLHR